MNIDAWLQAAIADVERRGLSEVQPLLTALARATAALRSTDFNDPHIDELAPAPQRPDHPDH